MGQDGDEDVHTCTPRGDLLTEGAGLRKVAFRSISWLVSSRVVRVGAMRKGSLAHGLREKFSSH